MLVAGVDEVGRGPLAGPVVTAAVILDDNNEIKGLADSKALSEKKRDALFEEIQEKALAISLGRVEPEDIDRLNIHYATLLAMKRAVDGLPIRPGKILVDGKFCPQVSMPAEAIIKGDGRIPCISAASIIAKVSRDREMAELDKIYPGYGLARHKGYPTKAHCQALADLGITPIHRRSFKPVAVAINNALA